MTRLLISVRSAGEARIALEGGADLIDVKEPNHGSLGAAELETIEEVVREVAGRVRVSAALGELLSGRRLPARLAGQLQFAKFGLAGCAVQNDWATRWQTALVQLPAGVTPVAVVYADWKSVLAPDPDQVLHYAQTFACGAVLLDTCEKSQGSLMNHFPPDELARFVAAVHRAGLLCVIAGGLGLAEIGQLLPLAPDYVAVRGAACGGDRTGRLDVERIRNLAALARGARHSELANRPS
jgi:(5-formylfuran-3-yl)methyl phosphate synthase